MKTNHAHLSFLSLVLGIGFTAFGRAGIRTTHPPATPNKGNDMARRLGTGMNRAGSVLLMTLLVLSLLVLTVLAFVAGVRMELRQVIAHQDHLVAQANARLGIELAIARLQESAGPDRRVTARSDMDPSAIQRHWTGVWRNPVSPRENANDPNWRRDESRKASPELLAWLVSGNAPDGTAPNPAMAQPFGGADRQVLLGQAPDPNDPNVEVDLIGGRVPILRPNTGVTEGSFGYWVGDEGIKAMAGQTNPHVAGWDRLKSFQASQRAGIELLDGGVANLFATAPTDALEARRVNLLERVRNATELTLLSGSAPQTASLRRIQPHITMTSFGVHADALYGGLKRDLSLGFEADDSTFNNMVDFAAPDPAAPANAAPTQQGGGSEFHYRLNGTVSTLAGAGVDNRVKYLFYENVPDHPAMGTANYTTAGGGAIRGNTWHQLRDYYRSYKRVQNPEGDATLAVAGIPYSEDMIYSHTSSGHSGDLMGQQSDNITQRNHFHRSVLPGQSSGWRPISRSLGNPIVPVLARERWIHSFSVEQGASDTEFVFDFALAPILTLWNPYNVPMELEEIEFEKHRFGAMFMPWLHGPRDGDGSLGFHSWLQNQTLLVQNRSGSILRNSYPGLADNDTADSYDWSVLMRINRTGMPGGGSIRLEPGELKVFSVGPGSVSVVDPQDSTRLLLYLKPFDLGSFGALQNGRGLVFEDAWRADVRNPHTPGTTDHSDYQAKLDRIIMADGSYNPELVIDVTPKDAEIQGSGGALDVSIRSGGEVRLVARHFVRFRQGGSSSVTVGTVWHTKDILDSYPMEGVWPRNFRSASEGWVPARGHAVQDLFGDRHAFIMSNFFLKPENYQVLFNPGAGRSMGRFPVPVMSYFNSTAPMHWMMTGVRSPHPVSDIWDGSSTVIDGPAWTSVPPYPGAAGFEPEDEVVDPDGKAYWGRAYDTRSPEASNRVVMREVPVAPLLSVGAFRHANLSLYENQAMYTAGESFPSPYVAPDKLWETGPFILPGQTGDRWTHSPMVNHRTQVDWTYLVNEALWDRFYFSGIAPNPLSNTTMEHALTGFIDQGKPLANARIALIHGRQEMLREALDANTGNATAESPVLPSRTTLLRGAFNVNSTSVEAWRTMLSATLGVDVLHRENGSVVADGDAEVPFPRHTIPASESGEPDTWQKYRGVDTHQIEALARALVAEIRRRGPFTSLSDFVNRRLAPAGDATALAGTIQAAIDATSGINDSSEFVDPDYLRDPNVPRRDRRLPADFPYPQHVRGGVLRQSAVSQLTQGDILQVIGPALSARSDTFKIISYGESVNPLTGERRARAYAEAVVQRFPDPLVPSASDPYEPQDPEIFGRRFRMISFTWLHHELDPTL